MAITEHYGDRRVTRYSSEDLRSEANRAAKMAREGGNKGAKAVGYEVRVWSDGRVSLWTTLRYADGTEDVATTAM